MTELNIINLVLIAMLFAILVMHAANADADLAPASVELPFTTSY